MSYALINTNDLTALGNAIRTKTGGSSILSISEMATAVSGITGGGGGWSPTTFSTIPSANITTEKYGADIDLSGYSSPFIAILYADDGIIEDLLVVIYYNGSSYTYLANQNGENEGPSTITNGVVRVDCSNSNTWANYGKYYIIT